MAALLRAVALGARLSDAEGYSWLVGAAPSAHAFLARLADYENTPPLFYLLLTPLPVDEPAWLRVPAAVPGVAAVLLVYLIGRDGFGRAAGLWAAALVAIAPYYVSYSDYARGFMLSNAGLLIALWGAIRITRERSKRGWWLYVGGGVLAVWSEYNAVFFLAALAVMLLILLPDQRRRVVIAAAIPPLTLLLWVPEAVRAIHTLDHTKQSPVFPGPSLTSLRELAVRLTAGEHGAGTSAGSRWAQFLLVAGGLGVALRSLWRHTRHDASRSTLLVLSGTAAGALVLHAFATIAGLSVFNQRYLTVLIPLAALVVGAFIATFRSGLLRIAASVVVVLVAAAVLAQRSGRELEPSLAPVAAVVSQVTHPTVLTNSAVVVHSLRHFNPILDRPFGLGPGKQNSCPNPCIVVDDTRVPGGARRVSGQVAQYGPFVVGSVH